MTVKTCEWYGCSNLIKENSKIKNFCSKNCMDKFRVKKSKMKIKIRSIYYKGGKCEKCGYDECISALEFHHLDPTQKDFSISQKYKAWNIMKNELDKCVMLCSNCHRLEHHNSSTSKLMEEQILNDFKKSKFNTLKEFVQLKQSQKNCCKTCGIEISYNGKECNKCSHLKRQKINWPSDEELAKLVWEKPRSTLAKELGVSDKAIAKRCTSHGIDQPSRGYWAKLYAKTL